MMRLMGATSCLGAGPHPPRLAVQRHHRSKHGVLGTSATWHMFVGHVAISDSGLRRINLPRTWVNKDLRRHGTEDSSLIHHSCLHCDQRSSGLSRVCPLDRGVGAIWQTKRISTSSLRRGWRLGMSGGRTTLLSLQTSLVRTSARRGSPWLTSLGLTSLGRTSLRRTSGKRTSLKRTSLGRTCIMPLGTVWTSLERTSLGRTSL